MVAFTLNGVDPVFAAGGDPGVGLATDRFAFTLNGVDPVFAAG
jgi:hypothetical protein